MTAARKKFFILFLIAATGLTGTAAAQTRQTSQQWKNYTNDKYRYTIDYPAALLAPQPEADAGDGRHFTAKDGADLAVYASYNVTSKTLPQALKETESSLAGTVTYKVVKPDWFVISGHKDAQDFYAKTYLDDDQITTMQITYPHADEAQFKPVIGRLASSFKQLPSD